MKNIKTAPAVRPIKVMGELKKKFSLFTMLIPGLLHLILFTYLPMFGVIIAFKKINFTQGILKSPWVGFANFRFLFNTSDAWIITRNTILYNLLFIFLGVILHLAVAIGLNEVKNKIVSKSCQTLMIMPHFLSMVVISYIAFAFFSNETGFMNHKILPMLGLGPVDWYVNPKPWQYILSIVHFWQGLGYGSIVYLASIAGIDKNLYEAAQNALVFKTEKGLGTFTLKTAEKTLSFTASNAPVSFTSANKSDTGITGKINVPSVSKYVGHTANLIAAYYVDGKLRNITVSGITLKFGENEKNGCGWRSTEEYNWWDWQIGTPRLLIDILMLMDFTGEEQNRRYLSLFHALVPKPCMTRSNFLNICTELIGAAVLENDLQTLEETVKRAGEIFAFCDENKKEGYYADGSYLFHEHHAMNAAYGLEQLWSAAFLIKILHGTPFAFGHRQEQTAVSWLLDGQAPFVFNRGFMRCVMGRYPDGGKIGRERLGLRLKTLWRRSAAK